jgi:hypothetical protein
LSGLTQFPHLHFTVRYHGRIVDPFAYEPSPGACGSGTSLWREPSPGLAYRPRRLLNAGFASGPVSMTAIESGALKVPPGRGAPALVAFVRAIGLQTGDIQRLQIVGPDRALLADHAAGPLVRPRAQSMLFTGRPPAGRRDSTARVTG